MKLAKRDRDSITSLRKAASSFVLKRTRATRSEIPGGRVEKKVAKRQLLASRVLAFTNHFDLWAACQGLEAAKGDVTPLRDRGICLAQIFMLVVALTQQIAEPENRIFLPVANDMIWTGRRQPDAGVALGLSLRPPRTGHSGPVEK
jgi:hypothetical protein